MVASVTVSSRGKLAKLLGVSLTMVNTYVDMGMPSENGCYDVGECQAWLNAYRASSGRKCKEDAGGEIDLRERRLLAECDKLEQEARAKRLKNDENEGRLLPSDEVRQEVAGMFLRIKQRLESFPDEVQGIAPSEIRPQMRAEAQSFIAQLLTEISGFELDVEGTPEEPE